MPSYLPLELSSMAVFTGSSSKGSPASQRPLRFESLKLSPHIPDSVTPPSQSGLCPKGVIVTEATPTFKLGRAALVSGIVRLAAINAAARTRVEHLDIESPQGEKIGHIIAGPFPVLKRACP